MTRMAAFAVLFTVLTLAVIANYFSGGVLSGLMRESLASAYGAAQSVGDAAGRVHLFSTRASLTRQLAEAQARADKSDAYYADYQLIQAELDALIAAHTDPDSVLAHVASSTEATSTSETTKRVALASTTSHMPKPHVTAARVLSSGNASPFGTMIVGAGTRHGVEPGDIVLASLRTAIGTVAEVSEDTVLVALFSAPGARSEVLIGSGTSTTPAQVRGRGNGNFSADVLRDASVTVGDIAVLRSGYVIATVGFVDKTPEDPAQQILLRAPTNLETLQFVDIVHTPRILPSSDTTE